MVTVPVDPVAPGGGTIGVVDVSGAASVAASVGVGVDTGMRSKNESQFSTEVVQKGLERTSRRTMNPMPPKASTTRPRRLAMSSPESSSGSPRSATMSNKLGNAAQPGIRNSSTMSTTRPPRRVTWLG